MPKKKEVITNDKDSFLEVVTLIKSARQKTLAQVNSNLIELYWNVGKFISQKIQNSIWGDGVVKELATFIAKTEPGIKGFSDKNLWRMKQFYETYCNSKKLSTLSREIQKISWSNNTAIISRCKSEEEREFYIKMCLKENYSFRELDRQIDSSLYERTMTKKLLLSKEAKEIDTDKKLEENFRDNYVLEFLNLPICKDKDDEVVEYALSRSLSPTMVSEYQTQLPDKKLLKKKLHEIEGK